MAVTLSNLNRFSKFFHHWKEKEIYNNIHIFAYSHRTVSMCRTTFVNLKVQICRKIAK